jgi:serine/threonine protein kinase
MSSSRDTRPKGSPGVLGDGDYRGYRLIEKIAEGGMGVIYRAEHTQIGRKAAVKIIKRAYCEDEELIGRFHREARAVNAIEHENIVDIFDFGRDSAGRVFFVMELLSGEPLSERMRRGPLRWSEGLEILLQTGRALSAAHAAGFIHRDIKPENIFLRDRSETSVKLLDFGIAKLSGSVTSKLTKTGAVFGTPAYMSPEQINGLEVDPRTDIYSLGVVAYEMFAGEPPFAGETLGAIIKQHLFEPPPPLRPHPAVRAPEGLAALIEGMLAKEVDERYPSIDAMLADLADLEADRPPSRAITRVRRPVAVAEITPEPVTLAPVKPDPQLVSLPEPAPRRSRWPLFAALALLLTGAAAAAIYAVIIDREPEQRAAVAVDAGTKPALELGDTQERAGQTLRDALALPDPAARRDGADALAAVRDESAVPPLARAVERDPDLGVRGHAAAALAVLGGADERQILEAIYGEAPPELEVWFDQALHQLGDDEARDRLRDAASSRELAVSLRAALALADVSRAGDKAAVKALTRLAEREAELADVAPYAGVVILTKLAALRHPEARRALIEALTRTDEAAQLAAAEGLARLGDEAARAPLARILKDAASPNRMVAGRALVFLGDYSGFEVLTAGLADSDPERRRQAAEGLAAIGERASLEPLAEMLGDPDERVQIAAAAALLMIAGLDPVLLSQQSLDWARSAITSQNWATRLAAARAIGDIPQDQAMPLFAAAVVDAKPEVRAAAARSARRMSGAEPARTLARVVRTEKNDAVAEEQIRSLAALAQPETREALASRASDRDRIGVLASGALIAVGDLGAVTSLERSMQARQAALRLATAEAAVIAGDPIVIPTLVLGLDDRDRRVKLAAAEGLSHYRAEKDRALPVLEHGLVGGDASVAGRAYAAMLRFGVTPRAGPTPGELLDSPDAVTRLAAVEAAAAMPWSEAGPLLRRAVVDVALEVRRRAVEVLADFGARHPDPVLAIYRSLVRDRDATTRIRAQAQLARLTRTRTAKAGPDIGDLEKAHAAVLADAAELADANQKLEAVVDEIEKATARPAGSDDDVDRVEALAADIGKRAAEVITRRAGLQKSARAADEIARDLSDPRAAELAAEVIDKGREGARIARAALAAGKLAEGRAKKFAADETADPEILLTVATTAIAAGKLGAARRDLARARQLFRAAGKTPADLHFADAELHAALARRAADTDKKIELLERARSSYRRFARSGAGFRVGQASERAAEISTEITRLLAQ